MGSPRRNSTVNNSNGKWSNHAVLGLPIIFFWLFPDYKLSTSHSPHPLTARPIRNAEIWSYSENWFWHWFNFHNVTIGVTLVSWWWHLTGNNWSTGCWHIMQIDKNLFFLNSWNFMKWIIKTKWNQIIFWPAIISSFSRGETRAVRVRQSWDLYTKYGMFWTRDLIVPITCLWPPSWNN